MPHETRNQETVRLMAECREAVWVEDGKRPGINLRGLLVAVVVIAALYGLVVVAFLLA